MAAEAWNGEDQPVDLLVLRDTCKLAVPALLLAVEHAGIHARPGCGQMRPPQGSGPCLGRGCSHACARRQAAA